MEIVNFSEARNNFKAVLDRVAKDRDCTVIVRRDIDEANRLVYAIDDNYLTIISCRYHYEK